MSKKKENYDMIMSMKNEVQETTALEEEKVEEKVAEILDNPTEQTEENANPQKPDYDAEIVEIIQSDDDPEALLEQLDDYHDNDLADALALMTGEERRKLYSVLPTDDIADIFERLDQREVETYIIELNENELSAIMSHMEADKAVDFLRMLPKERRIELIRLLNRQSQKDIAMIASYDEDQIGSRMSRNYVCVTSTMTIKSAMRTVVRKAAEHDNISTIYVEDEEGGFYGAIELTTLIVAREGQPLENLVQTSYPYVYGNEQIDDCIEKIKDYSEDSIPVLNSENHMVGIITSQDLVQVVDEEMGEDYARLAGLTAEEDLKEPLFRSMQKRLPWLVILLCLGLIVSSVIAHYSKIVALLPILMAFQSMILGMSGNVGTQSLGVTIRLLANEDMTGGQKIKLVLKEMRVGLCNGILLGTISFVLIGLYILLVRKEAPLFAFSVSGCIGLALITAMLISSFMGTVVPIFFHKIKIDPAVASGPLITTINDLVAAVTYYSLCYILLIQVLHLGQ